MLSVLLVSSLTARASPRPEPRRRGLGGAGVFALLVLMTGLLPGCASLVESWKAPEVALIGLQPKELGLTRQVFIATLAVKNPNDRTLPIKAMTYRLALEGQDVAEGGGALDRQIPAFGETTVDVEVIGSLLGLLQQLPVLALKERPLNWTVSGTATLAGGLITLPYRYSGKIDARELTAGGPRSF
ncbi:Water stress and hypersensitive response domain-containing protein [Thiocystis minor]|uniref:LEA type 2 family protein n=1 Tax=Thiocystis minor TaxID=61597 RepID=UPI001911B6FC|nr:LEA type 2 family protein [Thiocystis minor]MBK5966393.1 Water stress and hypersensitive response domain-containing protein [Thiocystis minor]